MVRFEDVFKLDPDASFFGSNAQSRPFGVALLIAGTDENGPQLYVEQRPDSRCAD